MKLPDRSGVLGAAGSALDLCLNLSRVETALTRRFDHRLGSLHGLSFGDFTILLHLGRAPESRLRRVELAGKLGLTASGVTRSLLPLEKIGLLTRQSDARDARVAYAVLTPAGQELLENALVSADQLATEVMQDCTPGDQTTLSLLLGLLTLRLA